MNPTYKVRTFSVFFVFCILFFIIIINLYRIQIYQHNFFLSLGHQQYNVSITKYPPRACIFDRHGQCLAMNKNAISAFILPQQLINKPELKEFLATRFPYALKRLNTTKSHFMFIQRKLTDEQIFIINNANISDLHLLKEPSRYYPIKSTGSVVGITNIDNKGQFGVEQYHNSLLSGTPTSFCLEKDARSGLFCFAKKTTVSGIDSTPITITLDGTLQFLIHRELAEALDKNEAKEGAILIMNPQSGEIISMVSLPNFDPNNTKNLKIHTTKNKIISESYELGSVIKVFAALAALEENAVTPDEMIDCQCKKTAYIDGRKINTVKAHGMLSFSEVIERSNNIGMAMVLKRVGTKLYDHYTKLGFGIKTGIKLYGEQSGFVNPPERWSKQSIISLSYGYEITATLLQLGSAFCMIANNGYLPEPKIFLDQASTCLNKKPLYSQKSLDIVKQILENTTLRGTAKRAHIKGYKVMSKTGTANLLVNGIYSPDKNIFTCAGIIQKGDYQRVIVVFVKESTRKNIYAATVAAPLFEKVATKMIIHDRII